MCTVYTYILHVRECARIYSGVSKRIPSLGSPSGHLRVESAHTTSVRRARVDRVRVHITLCAELREIVALDQVHIWHISIASHRLEIALC